MTKKKLDTFRERRNELYRNNPGTPLEPAEVENFAGLDYFPESKALSLKLELETDGATYGEIVELDTSSGMVKQFRDVGTVRFEVEGETVSMVILVSLQNGRLFVPFMDSTNGHETYVKGRFLEPQLRPDGKLVLDFNYAYNPYCAFSDGWSCPYPPSGNRLKVPIRAGEKGRVHGTGH